MGSCALPARPVPALDAELLAAVVLGALVWEVVVLGAVDVAVLVLGAVGFVPEVAEAEGCPDLRLTPWLADAGGLLGVRGPCARKGTMA